MKVSRKETTHNLDAPEIEVWAERVDATGENTGRFWLNIVETADRSLGIVMSRDELVEFRQRIDRALCNA